MTKTYNPIQYQQSRGYEIASENTSQNWGSNQDCPFDIQTGSQPFLRVRSIVFWEKERVLLDIFLQYKKAE